MTIPERIKHIRKDLRMSQEKFAETLGLSRDAISNIELGRVDAKDHILRLICKTHRVNYFYLTEGIGDPYVSVPEIIIEEAIDEYSLDSLDRTIIEEYVKLDPQIRSAIKGYLKAIFKNAQD